MFNVGLKFAVKIIMILKYCLYSNELRWIVWIRCPKSTGRPSSCVPAFKFRRIYYVGAGKSRRSCVHPSLAW